MRKVVFTKNSLCTFLNVSLGFTHSGAKNVVTSAQWDPQTDTIEFTIEDFLQIETPGKFQRCLIGERPVDNFPKDFIVEQLPIQLRFLDPKTRVIQKSRGRQVCQDVISLIDQVETCAE